MRKIGRKIMKLITKGFIGFTFVGFMLSASALDSENWISAFAVCITSFAILAMYGIAIGAMRGDWDER